MATAAPLHPSPLTGEAPASQHMPGRWLPLWTIKAPTLRLPRGLQASTHSHTASPPLCTDADVPTIKRFIWGARGLGQEEPPCWQSFRFALSVDLGNHLLSAFALPIKQVIIPPS